MIKRKFLYGKDWFFEDFIPREPKRVIWGFRIKKKIFSGKSKFQKIEIFESEELGRVLVLDGNVQLSTKNEYIYHEMLVHPPMFYHPLPERVLIIGGGDGGALREVVKYSSVKEIFLVDIDQKVIEVSQKYLPSVSDGAFKDPRVKIFIDDAFNFIKKYKNHFDLILEDLTEPIGPSSRLWQKSFFVNYLLPALKENGIIGFQTGFLKSEYSKKIRERLKEIFPYFKIHRAHVKCYPLDEHTFSFGSKKIDFNKFTLKKIEKKFQKLNIKTKYYSPEIHFSSSVLPKHI